MLCKDVSCYGKSCFVECNEMAINISFLRDLQMLRDRYEQHFNEKTQMIIYKLTQDFQNNFMKLCMDFETEYEKIIAENVK